MGKTFDIVHFNKYCFNDGSGYMPNHFALVALSKNITKNISTFQNQIYCFVITTSHVTHCKFHKLDISNYKHVFTDQKTKVVLDRIDMQSISDMSNNGNSLSILNKKDRRCVYGKYIDVHKLVLSGSLSTINKIVSGTIVRELKKNK